MLLKNKKVAILDLTPTLNLTPTLTLTLILTQTQNLTQILTIIEKTKKRKLAPTLCSLILFMGVT